MLLQALAAGSCSWQQGTSSGRGLPCCQAVAQQRQHGFMQLAPAAAWYVMLLSRISL